MTLAHTISVLHRHYGKPRPLPTSDPFGLVLWENVAYLATAERRREAFAHLKRRVGLSPSDILAADREALEEVTAHGILKSRFAAKLRECARIANAFGGDLKQVVRMPVGEAKRALRRFPGIGEPGAEKILLFTGQQPLLAPESNGLRVLARLGIIREDKSYARMYASAKEAALGLEQKPAVLKEAHLLLYQHGQTLCTRNAPSCHICPLEVDCAYGSRSARSRL